MSTDEEKLNRWREHFESVLNHVLWSEVPLFGPTTETISPARSIQQTPPSKLEIVSAIKSLPSVKAGIYGIPGKFYKSNPYMEAEVLQPILKESLFERSISRGMDRWFRYENSKKG